ncbi:MAG: GNAT family N-acetyltransferase [Bacteroidota bacterium]
MSVIIRFAGKEDAALVADISRQTFYDSFVSQNTKEDMDKFMNEQFTKEALINEVGAEGNIFLLAFIHEQPAGYVRMREGEKRPEFQNISSVEIGRIYAIQHSIGKGTGSALMQQCIEIAKEMHREVIWLGVWEHNQRAINFYLKWGFEKFGEHDFVPGNDVQTDWLMKKEIRPSKSP